MRTHGLASTYNSGCRCEPCTAAHAAANAAWAAKVAGEEPPEHGTVYTYRKRGCRCSLCTAANTEYQRELRARRKGQQ